LAFVNVDAAVVAGEAGAAKALEAVIHVEAAAAIGARLGQTEVDSLVAERSGEARRALALVLVDAVDAVAAILAWIAMAVVDVFLAVGALEASRTLTLVLVAANSRALAAIAAGIRIAVLHLQLAVATAIAGRALALEALTSIATTAAVLTRLACTCDSLRLAVPSNPTVAALTCVAVAREVVDACAVVRAWIHRAVFDFNLAVGADEAGWTLARVRALTGVGAGSAVVAWLVMGAEVEVLIAEQAAPALVAFALPLGGAGSVHTSWIHFTLVTVWSSVSALASVRAREEKQEERE
jgi:hypothetical protein